MAAIDEIGNDGPPDLAAAAGEAMRLPMNALSLPCFPPSVAGSRRADLPHRRLFEDAEARARRACARSPC